ncbi:Zinc finger protein [Drechslerella dactyloides]|uniref:Zinc finger protein n=1 Tax=Drechslerella dactyloides TaxID=74499 RepID=A0AAD6J3B8_DREDA|nr:Zinc finger protein [Drechslerella dactyloides]
MPRGGRGSHSTSVPVPLTQSALDARKSFYCELCGKGYGRMNEFEAHESSYDHQHKKRFMEMKQMQRGASSIEARRERERRAEEKAGLITIKPLKTANDSNVSGSADEAGSRVGRKGFKSAFGAVEQPSGGPKQTGGFKKAFTSNTEIDSLTTKSTKSHDHDGVDETAPSDTDDESYNLYDPSKPTL